MKRLLATLLTLLALGCGRAYQPAGSATSQSTANLNSKTVWALHKVGLNTRDLVFYVNPRIWHQDATYTWFYELNGVESGCVTQTHAGYVTALQINCAQPGALRLTLFVVNPDFSFERVYHNAELENVEQYPNLAGGELYLTEANRIMNLDGSPGPAYGGDPGGGGSQITGAQLYSLHCSSCHGTASASTKRGRTVLQIQTAIQTQPQMSGLVYLTSAEISKIAQALQ